MMARIWRICEFILMGTGLIAAPFFWLIIEDNRMKSAVTPPWSVQTLSDFRKWRPQYEQAVRLETRGSVYYLLFGERARTLASGPSGYLFDERGNLVGWSPDTGDDTYLWAVRDNAARKGSLSAGQIVIFPPPAGGREK